MKADYEEHFFDAEDALRLFFRRWFVPEPKGLVAIVHGYAEHSGRYQQLAMDLTDNGWSVATFDCRGHGQSGGRRAHIDRFKEYLDDVRSFLDEVVRAGYQEAPFLLGHSLGGLITTRYIEQNGERVAGMVLSSPFLGMAMKVPAIKVWAGKALSGIMPTLAMKSGLDPSWISHDRSVVDQYAADPLVSNIATARWFTETLQAQEAALEEASRVTGPLLVMQAGDDRLSSSLVTKRFFEVAGAEDKSLKVYEDFYHEIFNEVGRDQVLRDLFAWLESHRQ